MEPPEVLQWASRLTPENLPRFRSEGKPLSLLFADSEMMPWVEPPDVISILPEAPVRPGQIILGEREDRLCLTRAIAPLPDGRWLSRQDRADAREQAVWPLGVGLTIYKNDGPLALDFWWWRSLGQLLSRLSSLPGTAAPLARWTAVGRKLAHPFTPPLAVRSPAGLIRGVAEKYDHPCEVQWYDLTNPSGLDDAESAAVREFKPVGRILNVGCGAGREALALARAGFSVVAIDLAPAMVARARRNAKAAGFEIECLVMGTDDLSFPDESFDGVFFGWEIYGHVPGRRARVGTLGRIRRLLKPDGALLLFQSWQTYTTWISRVRFVDALRRVGRLFLGERLSEPGDYLLRGLTEDGAYLPLAFHHRFRDAREIRAELQEGGFSVLSRGDGVWVARSSHE